jgi:zinc protease
MLAIAFKAPAYTDTQKDTVALDALSTLAFSENSDLYQKLAIREQKVDWLYTGNISTVDPDLFTIRARIKRAEDVPYVRDQILETIKKFQNELVASAKLETVKKRERYGFALELDNSESVAQTVARYVALRRTPATIDRLFDEYGQLTPEDVRQAARKYLVEKSRTIVTLTGAISTGAGK